MDVASQSRERVADRIQHLEDTYGSFPINQSTLSVPESGYERAVERCENGIADVYVEARNGDDEVLLVRSDDAWEIPRGQATGDESLEAGAKRKLKQMSGVDCEIEGIHQVTILGVRNEDGADEPVYRLLVVFLARCKTPDTANAEAIEWVSSVPDQARP
ncbi:NUDIX domain-containing protein [Haloarculaceae archaeon H-GB2-1]|nr:NUDIX domain-containing protein [Haloarculaceae archaeon H-GB1-1]MEA5387758.1 NUDIX domain-containing protein [Haloarculaceae archaeon H-GB11]MEA5409251.1 NUDIX domain-containing protein [Haloarculaceae archaeon H-GB2-1]